MALLRALVCAASTGDEGWVFQDDDIDVPSTSP